MTAPQRRLWGLVGAFESPDALVAAARRARQAGYQRVDAHTPFQVSGLAHALGLPRPRPVALLTLVGGIAGATAGYALQYYTMAVDYPLNVGGRPLHSWPAFVPVTFELMVLCAALSATVSLFVLSGLPQPHHPLFGVPGFERASQDRFFLSFEASDPAFEPDRARAFLERAGAREVSEVYDE